MISLITRGNTTEIVGLEGNVEHVLMYIIQSRKNRVNPELIYFTDATYFGNGKVLKTFIDQLKIGEVIVTPPVHNPNSERKVEVFMFKPDEDAVKEFDATIEQQMNSGRNLSGAIADYKAGTRANVKKKEAAQKVKDEAEKPKGKGYKTEEGAARGIEGRETSHRIVFRDGLFRIVRR